MRRFEAEVLALGDALRARGEKLVAAESCTGGLFAAACTSVAGSSDWFERGFVTYSNEAKNECLGVPATLIELHGAVSEPVVRAMASGALRASYAQWAVAVTGIAGPGGAVPGKPVGTVWIGLGGPANELEAKCFHFQGERESVQAQAAAAALAWLESRLEEGAATRR